MVWCDYVVPLLWFNRNCGKMQIDNNVEPNDFKKSRKKLRDRYPLGELWKNSKSKVAWITFSVKYFDI